MESLVSFSKWLSKWFTVAVILWAAFNYALPATSSWVIPNTAYLLGLILFGMGLTLTTEDFKRIAKRPIPVVLGTVAHYVIMPGLAWLLCMIFHLKGATAAGVILVGSCPSGTSSSVMAFLSGGDVALDVSIDQEGFKKILKKYKPEFEMVYEVDPLKQSIANSWPDQMDDSAAREEWGWMPQYDLDSMTKDMLEKLTVKLLK